MIQNVSRDTRVDFIIIKRSKHQEVITIIKIFIPKHSTPKGMKQKLIQIKADIDTSAIIGTSILPLSTMYKH